MNHIALSKKISHILRHDPASYGLSLDCEGAVPLNDLLCVLKNDSTWSALTVEDIKNMISLSAKARHEIFNNKIRALYGHTVDSKVKRIPAIPPMILYHGTPQSLVRKILQEGLLPQKREYVHLTSNLETSMEVAKRYSPQITVLKVDTVRATQDGVVFYPTNDDTWLSKFIHSQYIVPYT